MNIGMVDHRSSGPVANQGDFVESVEIEELFGSGSTTLEFDLGVNILTGHNGSLKTTVLQILANALRGDFDRFVFLEFKSVSIHLRYGNCVTIKRYLDRDDVTGVSDHLIRVESGTSFEVVSTAEVQISEPLTPDRWHAHSSGVKDESECLNVMLPARYLPAFRTTVDALRSLGQHVSAPGVTTMIRYWRTPFVPYVSYPALSEIEEELKSTFPSRETERYVSAVNSFFEGKQLIVDRERSEPKLWPVRIQHDGGGYSRLGALSSGEREIVILLYAAASADRHQVLLIDEPENSLHVAWQRKLLDRMAEVGKYSQVIACTHSPVIASRYPAQEITFQQDHPVLSDDVPYEF